MCNSLGSLKVQFDTVGERLWLNIFKIPKSHVERWICVFDVTFSVKKSLQHMDLESGFIACRNCCEVGVIPQYFSPGWR